MRYCKILLIGIILLFGLACISFAEDYTLQDFLSKASSKTIELSKKEKTELLNQLDGVMKRAQGIHTQLIQAVQTGETDVRYQEGKFWMSKLEEDQGSIESGALQLKTLREKTIHLVAAVKLYKSLKDLSFHFNAYNNMSSFSAYIGDVAPELALWADPVFYRLYLLPLAQAKSQEAKPTTKEKRSEGKAKRP